MSANGADINDDAGESAVESPIKPARNAFTTMMSKSPKMSLNAPTKAEASTGHALGNGLGFYIRNPEKYPDSVISYDKDFVFIYDMYPKSTIHCLLLPRDDKINKLNPWEALSNPEFLAIVKPQAEKLKRIAAKRLERQFGHVSVQEQPRQAALHSNLDRGDDAVLPPGRDWEKEIRVGIHLHPSMAHLHIHVISKDMSGLALKNRKHYNSFNTRFFVDLHEFPTPDGLEGYRARANEMKKWNEIDLQCWRCGQVFGNKFAALKKHLAEEFEVWKRE